MSAKCNPFIPRAQCTIDTCCLAKQGFLNYQPTIAGNTVYAVLFIAILLVQIFYVVRYRKTWGYFTGLSIGLLLEVLGYVGRLLLHNNPFSLNNFVIYLVCLTIGPAFFMASIYLLMGRVVVAYGAHHSPLKPLYYSAICMTGDLISLVLQATGGAMAAIGSKGNGDKSQTDTGVHIMIAGLSFQLFATVIFAILCGMFFSSVLRNRDDRSRHFSDVTSFWRFKAMLGGMFVATLLIFIRSAFRVDELKDGFRSDVANNETLFMVFEGPMLILAGLAMTIFHPGPAFRGKYADANYSTKKNDGGSSDNVTLVQVLPNKGY